MKGNFHVWFLGEKGGVILPIYQKYNLSTSKKSHNIAV
jgi:hypothetical protein